VIVVDTSVWIDVLGGRQTKEALRCIELVEGGEPVALTDVVFAELLQGVPSEDEAALLERHLRAFPILRLQALDDYALAASLYRNARAQGITIRNTLDCLIAAPCVRTGAPLLHADADFDRLASCSSLRIFS
jgi:predicted nucleic acid-binding protein